MADLPDDDACLEYLWRQNFSDDGSTARCPSCRETRRFTRAGNRPSYRCTSCGHHLHPSAGTIFQKSSTPLRLWFRAISLMADSGSTISARQLERELGVTYKTAWRMAGLIRTRLVETGGDLDDPRAKRAAALARATRADGRVPPSSPTTTTALWAPGVISTFAGDGTPAFGGDGGPATGAQLNNPYDVAVDSEGSVFIADEGNHVIRKVDRSGVVSTVAGTGIAGYSGDGGPAAAAQLHGPTGVAVDGSGNLFVADHYNHRIRRVDEAGTIVTIAGDGTGGFAGDGGPATEARLEWPGRVLPVGDTLLISDYLSNRVRHVDAAGVITTVAGTGANATSGDGGLAVAAAVMRPNGLAVDIDGRLYLAQACDPDTHCARVRVISPTGVITTFAGSQLGGFAGDGGPAHLAWLSNPHDVVIEPGGGVLIADLRNNRIRRVDPDGTILTVVGTGEPGFGGNGGAAIGAQLHRPAGLALTPDGDLLIADSWNHRVRRVTGPVPEVWQRRTQGIHAVRRRDTPSQNGPSWRMWASTTLP